MKAENPKQFLETALKYQQQVDSVLDEREVSRQRVVGPELRLRRLRDAPDLVFFSLGPVYYHLRVDRDILGEFHEITGQAFQAHTVRFTTPVVEAMEEWSYLLQAVPVEVFSHLERFMQTQRLTRKEEGEYWTVYPLRVDIPDPYVVQNRDMRLSVEPHARVVLFLPSGIKYRLTAAVNNLTLPVPLFLRAPDPAVVQEAKAGLSAQLTEEEYQRFFKERRLPFVT